MLSRPLGLGALGLMLVVETFRRRALLFHGAPFLLEWGAAVGGVRADAARPCTSRSSWSSSRRRGSVPSLRYLLATAIAYPLVVLGLAWCLRVRAPRAVAAYRLGRLP